MQVFGTQKVNNTVISTSNVKDGEITDARNLLLFSGCADSTFTVKSTCTKVLVENCTNLSVVLPQTVRTQCLEVVNCKNVTFEISVPIFTATVDKSENINVSFSAPRFFQTFYVAHVKNVLLTVTPAEPVILTVRSRSWKLLGLFSNSLCRLQHYANSSLKARTWSSRSSLSRLSMASC